MEHCQLISAYVALNVIGVLYIFFNFVFFLSKAVQTDSRKVWNYNAKSCLIKLKILSTNYYRSNKTASKCYFHNILF